ncbi:MAG: L-lactate dehydrogenase [Planctomycetota bacterium]
MAQREPSGATAKVTIVGAGLVGSTCAYSLMVRGIASEIVLIDIDRERAEGEAMDLNHALSFGRPARIAAGDYGDADGTSIAILTAGAAQKAGESRLSLAKTNVKITRNIVAELQRACPDAVLLVVANPVDILTYAALKHSDYPPERVFGSGTILDTARLRSELSRHCGFDPHNIHAYIIGEHGDSEVPVWSLANVAGMRLREFCPACGRDCGQEVLDGLFENAKNAAYQIIERKGATYYAIALGVARVVEAILRDQRTVMTVSTLIDDGYCGIDDVCLSLPTCIGRSGILQRIPLQLTPQEKEALRGSAETLQGVLRDVGLQ